MKNFYETSISRSIGKIMLNRSYGWNERCTEVSIKCLMEGFAVYLGRNKSKDTPVAITLVDANNQFHFGMWVEYNKQDEEGSEDSWHLGMTFSEKDIDMDNWTVAKYPESQVAVGIVDDVCYTRFGGQYKFAPKTHDGKAAQGSPQELFCICLDTIADYMRANVSLDPDLEMPHYFYAKAQVESDGSTYIEMTPAMALKQHIKDDLRDDEKRDAEPLTVPTLEHTFGISPTAATDAA